MGDIPQTGGQGVLVALMILIAPTPKTHRLNFLVPSVTPPNILLDFVITTGWGDFISALLTIVCLFALKQSWRFALPLVWIFNIVGIVDLIAGRSQADAVSTLGGTWHIPMFLVALLLVSHITRYLYG